MCVCTSYLFRCLSDSAERPAAAAAGERAEGLHHLQPGKVRHASNVPAARGAAGVVLPSRGRTPIELFRSRLLQYLSTVYQLYGSALCNIVGLLRPLPKQVIFRHGSLYPIETYNITIEGQRGNGSYLAESTIWLGSLIMFAYKFHGQLPRLRPICPVASTEGNRP